MEFMKSIHDKVNTIPVIVKADILTESVEEEKDGSFEARTKKYETLTVVEEFTEGS